MDLPFDPAIPLLGIYLKEPKTYGSLLEDCFQALGPALPALWGIKNV